MCIEFQHLSCQVGLVVIKGLAYLLKLCYWRCLLTGNWKTGLTLAFTRKKLLSHSRPRPCVYGLGLTCLWPWLTGLGLDTSGLVNIPANKKRMSDFVHAYPSNWHKGNSTLSSLAFSNPPTPFSYSLTAMQLTVCLRCCKSSSKPSSAKAVL